jgi:NADPH:quinone reductase
VLHFAGDPAETASVVRRGGRLASTRIMSADQVQVEDVSVLPIYANPTPDILDRLAEYQAQGATRVVIQRTYPLDQAPQALTDFASGTLGKLIITTR